MASVFCMTGNENRRLKLVFVLKRGGAGGGRVDEVGVGTYPSTASQSV